jgi:ubiquinone/menaquinone biosynthesis C-methylase UbiE
MALMVSLSTLLLRIKTRGKSKGQLYDLLYGMRWRETSTNNYGFAPAFGQNPERFQLQMYAELYGLLRTSGQPATGRLLEISCGRGGGLNHLVKMCKYQIDAVGFDFSMNAVAFCKARYVGPDDRFFVRGDALHLPFNDWAFDIVVNVEASNAYGDERAFFREVHRILRPNGRFLYADSHSRRRLSSLEQLLHETGFAGRFIDVTRNVVSACELDSARRRALIRTAVPWYWRILLSRRLEQYAAVPGSKSFERFRTRKKIYFMTCMVRSL